MLHFYKTSDGKMLSLEKAEDGCWISAINPTETEIHYLTDELGLDSGFVRAALDEEETSRIEQEGDQTLIIIDYPTAEKETENKTILYSTIPMGIIVTGHYVITICLSENLVIHDFANGLVKNVSTPWKTHFVLMILFRVASKFLSYLKQIDKISQYVENQLHKSMKNKELIQLLGLEKSLVFFSTSLKANEMTLKRILRGKVLKLYEDDQELLEDVLIEVRQAIEMSEIYTNILSGTMDAFASIISNNLNIVMKVLTALTIVMNIPTMIASFYGMNVEGLPFPTFYFPLGISLIATVVVTLIFIKTKMFK